MQKEVQEENLQQDNTENNQNNNFNPNASVGVYPSSPYSIYKGYANGNFDGFLDYLDQIVLSNIDLINKKYISKTIINPEPIDFILLNHCKTQTDYDEFETLLEYIKDLGGIATKYYNISMHYLSKIHFKGMSDSDIQENKQLRQKSVDEISNCLSKEDLYSKLNLQRVIKAIKLFEESPSIQSKNNLLFFIRCSISKCENQEDLDFLRDSIERISSHTLFTLTFITDEGISMESLDLHSNFDEFLLKGNIRRLKIIKDSIVKWERKDSKNQSNSKIQSSNTNVLIQNIEKFVADTIDKVNGLGGMVEFDVEYVASNISRYRSQLDAIRGEIDNQIYDKLDRELGKLKDVVSYVNSI